MEFWSISKDGDGNFSLYPTWLIGAGAVVVTLFVIIKILVNAIKDGIYNFANSYTWIVVLVISIISILISIIMSFFLGIKKLHITILFGISLTQSLSLCYSQLIYYVGGFIEGLQEVFIGAFLSAPIFFIFIIVQFFITMALSLSIIFSVLEEDSGKFANIFSTVLGVGINILFGFLVFNSQLPEFIF